MTTSTGAITSAETEIRESWVPMIAIALGQALMWLSLGFALLYLVGQLPRRREGRTFGLRPVDDDDEDIGHDDAAT